MILEDGTPLRVNYDSHNGYSYSAIGRALIEQISSRLTLVLRPASVTARFSTVDLDRLRRLIGRPRIAAPNAASQKIGSARARVESG